MRLGRLFQQPLIQSVCLHVRDLRGALKNPQNVFGRDTTRSWRIQHRRGDRGGGDGRGPSGALPWQSGRVPEPRWLETGGLRLTTRIQQREDSPTLSISAMLGVIKLLMLTRAMISPSCRCYVTAACTHTLVLQRLNPWAHDSPTGHVKLGDLRGFRDVFFSHFFGLFRNSFSWNLKGKTSETKVKHSSHNWLISYRRFTLTFILEVWLLLLPGKLILLKAKLFK